MSDMRFGNRDPQAWEFMLKDVGELDKEIKKSKEGTAVSDALQNLRQGKLIEGLNEYQRGLWYELFEASELGGSDLIAIKYKLSHVNPDGENPRMELSDLLDLLYVSYEMTAYEKGRDFEDFCDQLFEFLKKQKGNALDRTLREKFQPNPVSIERHMLRLIDDNFVLKNRLEDLLKLKNNPENHGNIVEAVRCLVQMEKDRNAELSHVVTIVDDKEAATYVDALMKSEAVFEEVFSTLIKRVRNAGTLSSLLNRLCKFLTDKSRPENAKNYSSDFSSTGAHMVRRASAGAMIHTVNSECEALFCERLIALDRLFEPVGITDIALIQLLGERPKLKDADTATISREKQILATQQKIQNKKEFQNRLRELGLMKIFRTEVSFR